MLGVVAADAEHPADRKALVAADDRQAGDGGCGKDIVHVGKRSKAGRRNGGGTAAGPLRQCCRVSIPPDLVRQCLMAPVSARWQVTAVTNDDWCCAMAGRSHVVHAGSRHWAAVKTGMDVDNDELLKELRIERHQREDHGDGRGRWPWIAGGLIAVLVLLGGAGWMLLGHRAVAVQTATAVAPTANSEAGAVLQAKI